MQGPYNWALFFYLTPYFLVNSCLWFKQLKTPSPQIHFR